MEKTSESARAIEGALESETLSAEAALEPLLQGAREAPSLSLRSDACHVLGAIAGQAFAAKPETADKAAFGLLAAALEADSAAERILLLDAMGRAFHNPWLLPYVHVRLSDDDEGVVAAALSAAGGLAFPALEEAIAAGFLADDTPDALRLSAISALGRMGAESAAARLVPLASRGPTFAKAVLSALTEIRSTAGREMALALLARDPPPAVTVAAMRYLAEMGDLGVMPTMRRLAREADAEMRVAAGLASRAWKAERTTQADERLLAALTEKDRAVRAALARRLRTLPVAAVLEQAELLLTDDAEGIVAILAELRGADVTKLLLRLAGSEELPMAVRARAAGAIEANEAWEQMALVELVTKSSALPVRVAAAQTLGAFASLAFVLEHLSPLAPCPHPELYAAILWAVQLAARPGTIAPADRAKAEALVARALADADPAVQRRAAYVAGNLDAKALVPDLIALARRAPERADLRLAAFVAMGEIGSPARFADMVFLWNGESDPDALGAMSRAIERSLAPSPARVSRHPPSLAGDEAKARPSPASAPPPSLDRAHDRLPKLLASPNATVRAAAARVAGLTVDASSAELVLGLAADPSPRVRAQAVTALGRLGRAGSEKRDGAVLELALGDADAAVQERAALALIGVGRTLPVLGFVALAGDRAAARRVAARLQLPSDEAEAFQTALDGALRRLAHDDAAYEPLMALKIASLEAGRTAPASVTSIDAAITQSFPTWPRLSQVRAFAPLAKSVRTAEMLFAGAARGADTDLSGAIVLWSKALEGYMHAWLGAKLRALQEDPRALWDTVDHLVATAWPSYQRYLSERWPDPVKVGTLSVDLPLRSVTNALREYQDRRLKPLDSPPSVTEWSRLMLFFAVDHPTGAKNLFKVSCKDADRTVRLAHRLHVLAQVRNAVTHRAVAEASTLAEFRRAYYTAFEELTAFA